MYPFYPSPSSSTYPLAVGLSLASLSFWGNLALELVGPLTLVTDKLGKTGFGPSERVRVFARYFMAVAPLMGISAAITLLATLYTGFFSSAQNPPIRNIAHLASLINVALTAHTFIFIFPTNYALLDLDKQVAQREGKDGPRGTLSEAEGKRADQLMRKWGLLHLPRIAGYAVIWGAVGAALALDLAGK